MQEHFLLLFYMLICALILAIIAAIGITVANRITEFKRRAIKPTTKPIPFDDTTSIQVSMHGRIQSITMSWRRVKQDYLFSLSDVGVSGIANALKTEGAWSGNVADINISLKIKKG